MQQVVFSSKRLKNVCLLYYSKPGTVLALGEVLVEAVDANVDPQCVLVAHRRARIPKVNETLEYT